MRQVHVARRRLHESVLYREDACMIRPQLVHESLVVALVEYRRVGALDGLLSFGDVGWQVMEPQLYDAHA